VNSPERIDIDLAGRLFFGACLAAFLLIAIPVVLRGAPLADDFVNCVGAQEHGVLGFFVSGRSWGVPEFGIVRPARLFEIALIGTLCHRVAFGFAILVPLGLTVWIAFLVRGLLGDLSLAPPWADIGAGLWLLAPLGTESALWPSALHLPLGLGLALVSLRRSMRGEYPIAAVAAIGACLSAEQVIFALPLATWLVCDQRRKRMAELISFSVSALVLFVYVAWHGAGQDPRVAASIGERIRSIPLHFLDYAVVMPAIGLGLLSMPLAVKWALPYSLLVLLGGAAVGWSVAPKLLHSSEASPAAGLKRSQILTAFLLLVILINFPVAAGPYHPHSPRVFTPTWLALVMFAAFVGSNSKWRRLRLLGGVAGVLIAGILLSLAFSVSVRVRSATVAERAFHVLAQRLPGGGVIAVCGVQRTIVEPAPNGDFAGHPFILAPVAESALRYYTGVRAVFHLTGPLWGTQCTGSSNVDLAVQLRDLVAKSKTW
jgi:hypothetical protein